MIVHLSKRQVKGDIAYALTPRTEKGIQSE